ncbi:hypothetical protein FS842_008576 [Serendipita sp. 407]|nr:hypothetical protein FS842_008576 [Serendipita sp. 407]
MSHYKPRKALPGLTVSHHAARQTADRQLFSAQQEERPTAVLAERRLASKPYKVTPPTSLDHPNSSSTLNPQLPQPTSTMEDLFCACCIAIGQLFSILPCQCRCCDDLCCCGDNMDDIFGIPNSDLRILWPKHLPNTIFLMTASQIKPYEKKAPLLSWEPEVLDNIPGNDRILISGIPEDPNNNDVGRNAVQTLMSGIKESEARSILGGDRVDMRVLKDTGITTSAQLRSWRAAQSS